MFEAKVQAQAEMDPVDAPEQRQAEGRGDPDLSKTAPHPASPKTLSPN